LTYHFANATPASNSASLIIKEDDLPGRWTTVPINALSQKGAARLESAPAVSQEIYRKALDTIFPRHFLSAQGWRAEACLTLRFMPSFGSEAQINLVKHVDGSIEATVFELPKGSESLIARLRESQKKREDLWKTVEKVTVEKRIIAATEKLRHLFQQLALIQVPAKLASSITLDGVRFELWYETVSSSYHYSLSGTESVDDQQPHPLIKWMSEVSAFSNENRCNDKVVTHYSSLLHPVAVERFGDHRQQLFRGIRLRQECLHAQLHSFGKFPG
jgi:hypothetical protein